MAGLLQKQTKLLGTGTLRPFAGLFKANPQLGGGRRPT